MAEYYYNEDGTKVAVLVSPGYGAGWSTWNNSELAYDKRVVEFWLAHKDNEKFMEEIDSFSYHEKVPALKEAEEFFKSIGYSRIYFGGFNQIELEWVPVGCRWRIDEYDGSEHIEFLSMDNYNYVPAKGENYD